MGSIGQDKRLLTPLAQQLCLSPTLEINELVAQKRAEGNHVIHLGFGEATFPVQRDVLERHRAASQHTSYLPVAGLTALREAIAKSQTQILGTPIRADQVVVAPGSKPLLFALFDVISGDVLLPRPSWVSYEPQVKHAGKKLFWVETDQEDRHSITESSLRDAYDRAVQEGGDPRLMLINNPSNPTGQAFSPECIEILTSFCEQRDIALISDEIYADICFESAERLSVCSGHKFNEGRKILTGGLSKTYSAGGWRVGYAVFPDNEFGATVQKTVLAYASECWSAASAPAQDAAALAFSTSPEMDLYRRQVTSVHRQCTLRLYEALRECGLAVARPKGAFYVYPSFHPYTAQLERLGIMTALQLSRWLIEECGIAALPGSAFGEDDGGLKGGRFRLRMATSYLYFENERERYEKGYAVLESGLVDRQPLELPLLEEAIQAIKMAVEKLRKAQVSQI